MTDLFANRYRPLAPLGRGAMGEVWRVADTRDAGREVALKRIAVPGAITPALQLRFKEEFRAMTRLKHPNTIEVYDYGQLDDATRYLTMEIVDGQDLDGLTQAGPLPFEQVYPLLIQLLQALAFIHARRYVHRDVKAANVLVRADGHLKLMDFGLMAPLNGLPGDERLAGTPATMAPEIVRGLPPTEGADLYAVGCLAHQLVTGQLPFQGGVRDVLRAQVGTPPPKLAHKRPDVPDALEAIVAKLLHKDPRDRYAAAADVIEDLSELTGVRLAKHTPEQKRSYLISGELIGREAELLALEHAIDAVKTGHGCAIYVAGPAGTGKTRLAREAVTLAMLADLTPLEAACQERVAAPYGALAASLRPLLSQADPEVITKHRPALARLFPELTPEGAGPRLPLADAEKPWIHAATIALLKAAKAPLVWLLDDIQWCDPRSLQAFHHVLRHLEGLPLLAIATLRDDELPEGAAAWLAVGEGRAQVLRLKGLPADRLPDLLGAMLGPTDVTPALARALHGATGGNPLFVTEVLRDLLDAGLVEHHDGRWRLPEDGRLPALPSGVDETVRRRLARLEPAARELARTAAVLGKHLNRDMWRRVAGLEEDDFLDRLAQLVERQFVARDGARLTFPHDRVREALYFDLEPDERAYLHRRCGEYLEGRQADPDAQLTKLAHHFGRSDCAERGFRYARLAGDRAQAAGMGLTALRHWQVAADRLAELRGPETAAARRALRRDMGATGYHAWPEPAIEALEAYLADLSGAEPENPENPENPEEAEAQLAVAYGLAGRPAEGLALAQRLLAKPPAATPAAQGARLMAQAPSLFMAGRFDELVAVARAAEQLLGATKAGPRFEQAARVAAIAFQNAVAYQGLRPDDAARDRALQLAEASEIDEVAINVGHYHGLWCAWTGRVAEGEAHLEAAQRRTRRLHDAFNLYLRPCLLMQEGAYEEAAALVAQARRYPAAGQVDLARHLLHALDGLSRFGRGDLDGAAEALAEAHERATRGGLALVRLQALLGLGRVAIARHDLGRAEEAVTHALALAEAPDTRNPLHAAIARRLLAAVHARAGRPQEADRQLDAALADLQDNPLEEALIALARGDAWRHEAGHAEAARLAYLQAGERFHALGNRYRLYEVNGRLAALAEAPPPADAESPEARWMFLKALNA